MAKTNKTMLVAILISAAVIPVLANDSSLYRVGPQDADVYWDLKTTTYKTCIAAARQIPESALRPLADALMNCYDDETKIQDSRLNRNYKEIMKVIPEARKITLRDEERKWIALRDKTCKPGHVNDNVLQTWFYADSSYCIMQATVGRNLELIKIRDAVAATATKK
jgi:uncharacterized protein YecT (DUF1311 family)